MKRLASGDNFATYELGGLTVTSLRDGFVDMPVSRLRQPGDEPFGESLPPQVQLVNGGLRLSVNAFAIDEGDAVVLIDTGASDAWHPSMGSLPAAMAEAGIHPDKIATVAFTHTHIDHINGLILPDGRNAFPNLTRLLLPKEELDLFRAEKRLERFHGMAATFSDGQRISSALEALSAPGHEVGHSCFRVGSRGETLLVWGDIVHVPSLQFEQPAIAWEFDADQEAARASRLRIMELAADSKWHVAGAHLESPGLGRIVRSGASYAFEPI